MKTLLISLLLGCSLWAQTPTVQPQPNTATYGVSVLNLFPEYDRASFQATFGVQAPAYNPNRAPKTWFDSTAKVGNNTYNVMGTNAETTINLSQFDAANVNLKGFPSFATFRTAPQNVVISAAGGVKVPLNANTLATAAEVAALKAEIGDQSLAIVETVGNAGQVGSFTYQKVDASSPYSLFTLGGQNAGLMLNERNARGVGYPGTWTKTAVGYAFAPGMLSDGSSDSQPFVPVPVRELMSNEKFTTIIAGIIPLTVVGRTDMASPDPGATGGGFTTDDRATLQQVLALLKKLMGQ